MHQKLVNFPQPPRDSQLTRPFFSITSMMSVKVKTAIVAHCSFASPSPSVAGCSLPWLWGATLHLDALGWARK